MTAAPPAAGAALELILRATVLMGAAWAAAAMLRKAGASAAARHRAWQLGIFAMLALPFIWWLAPPLRLPILAAEEVHSTTGAGPYEALAPTIPESAPIWGLILLAYLIGAAAVLLRFAFSRYLVARLWRQAEPAREADWQATLADLSGELRLSRPTRLRIARGAAMPMTWGTLTPRILLPAEARAWPAERRRHVLLHELAHVARRDSFGRSAASLACALYWFHPGAWLAARRLRLEQEYAADDRVLNAGARPKSYARSLLDLAFGDETRRPDHAAAMAGICQLEQRVVSITATARREAPGAAFHAASAAITALTLLAVGAALPVRQPPGLSGSPAIESAFPDVERVSAPAVASGAHQVMPDRGAIPARPPGRTQDGGSGESPAAAALAGNVGEAEAPPIVTPIPAQQTALAQAATPPASLGPIGPQLRQPLPEERDTDPRIPAALRRSNTERHANQRAGPGPPRSAGEEVLRTLPTAVLQATGILRSN